MIRCKFRCDSIEPLGEDKPYCDMPDRIIVMRAVHSPEVAEDVAFTKYTPSGELKVQINNPKALEALIVGGYYYLDLTPVATQA